MTGSEALFGYRDLERDDRAGQGCPDDERRARAELAAAVEPGSVGIARKVHEIGPLAAVALLRRGAGPLDSDRRVQRRLATISGDELLTHTEAVGARFICPGDAEWPDRIAGMVHVLESSGPATPPYGMWLRGPASLPELTERSVAIVGARAATEYGMTVAADLAADLALASWCVVSGGAYGIDASAHRGALAVDRPTIAVLACGVDMAYPRGHDALLRRIRDEGLIVSERPPGSTPTRKGFLKRNRLIAALTRGTVVVEAALRSGALSTAKWADDLHRTVVAIPGPVTSAMSDGCHKLVRENGAVLATSAVEVVDAIGDLSVDAAPERRAPDRPLDLVDPTERDVFEALPGRGAASVDELCVATGITASACLTALGSLAAAGFVTRSGPGWQLAGGARNL